MKIGILKEIYPENRVALLPEHLSSLQTLGVTFYAEQGCGVLSFADDAVFAQSGAKVITRDRVLEDSDIILCINPLPDEDFNKIKNKILVGNFFPIQNKNIVALGIQNNINIFSLDMLPRNTRAQSMDVLSSQANIAGYQAVILAAKEYPRYFPMFITAAGSIPPAKVLILGAGVAGLQALATAKRLGAVVEVFDTRPAVKEEVLSLGGKFIEVEGAADASQAGGYAVEQTEEFRLKQKEKIAQSVAKADIIITTAQIPGKRAPILVTEEMIATMRKGSVIIDLAAITGGNTPFTVDGAMKEVDGVKVIGDSYLPRQLSSDASKLYGKNMVNFISLFFDKEKNFLFNENDDLLVGTCITKDKELYNERLKNFIN